MAVAVLAVAPTLAACGPAADLRPVASDTASDTAASSGRVVSEPRIVAGVTAVELTTPGTLMIDQTGTESLTIEAEDTVLPLLSSDVAGGVLSLGVREDASVTTTRPIVYRLTVRMLDAITVAGSGDVIAANLDTGRLTTVISGSGEVRLAGSADVQDVQISGSGDYAGGDLPGASATVAITGSGEVTVRVSDALAVTIIGSGDVRYFGSPRVTKNITGSGDVRPG